MTHAASTDSLKTFSDSSIISMLSKEEKNKVIKFVFQADTSKTVCDTVSGFTDIEREYCRRRHQLWNGK